MTSKSFLHSLLLLIFAATLYTKTTPGAPKTQVRRAQSQPELVVQLSHSAGVTALAFSPDNSLLATSGEDSAIKLWETRTHLLRREFMVGDGHIGGGGALVAFTPSSKILISAGRRVQFWSVASGQLLRTIDPGWSGALALSADGRTLALSVNDEVQIWALSSASPPSTTSGTAVREEANFKRIRVIRELPSAASSLSFSHNGLLALGLNGEVRVVKVATGEAVYDFNGVIGPDQKRSERNYNPVAVAFAPDNSLVMGFYKLFLWDGISKTTLLSAVDLGFDSIHSLTFAANGKKLMIAGDRMHLLSWPNLRVEHILESELAEVAAATLSPDGTLVANGVSFNVYAAQMWNARTGGVLATWEGRNGGVNDVAVSANSRYLATATDDGPLRVLDLATSHLDAVGKSRESLSAVMFAPNNNWVSNDRGEVWDVRTKKLVRHYDSGVLPFEPRLPFVAAAAKKPFEGFGGEIEDYDESPDGRLIAAAVGDYNDETLDAVEVWDKVSGKLLHRLTSEGGVVKAIRFIQDEKMLVAGYEDGSLKFWNTRAWNLYRTVRAHAAPINRLRLTANGRHLLSAGNDYQVKIWNCSKGTLEATLVILPPAKEDEFSKEWVVYTPDGLYDGSSGAEKFIHWRRGDKLLPSTWGKALRRKNLLKAVLTSR